MCIYKLKKYLVCLFFAQCLAFYVCFPSVCIYLYIVYIYIYIYIYIACLCLMLCVCAVYADVYRRDGEPGVA